MPVNSKVVGITAIAAAVLTTNFAVHRFQLPGHLDVITAQAMDMSTMRPPVGAAEVTLASVTSGSLAGDLTYTGSVAPYNEQVVTPRIVGTVTSLPVYPGDTVRNGQLLAQLDTSELEARSEEADDNANGAEQAAQVALLTHHLHHQAALDQASASSTAAVDAVGQAKAEESAAVAAVADAKAGVVSAEATQTYWKTELPREQRLAAAGAVSQQDYSNETAQAAAAEAAVDQARAKVAEAKQADLSALAKIAETNKEAAAAEDGTRMAAADMTIAEAQIDQTASSADSAKELARAARIVQGYATIVSPADGVVTERPIAAGTLVQPGEEILKIDEIDKVRIQANVAVTDLGGITVGSPVTVVTDAINGPITIHSRVSSIFPSANSETRTAVVEAVVPNPGHRLLPGAFVTMKLTLDDARPGLLVPSSAITSLSGSSYLWIVNVPTVGAQTIYACTVCHMHYSAAEAARMHYRDPMDGGQLLPIVATKGSSVPHQTVHQIPVTVISTGGDTTEVQAAGIAAGAQVVTRGQDGLVDGASITVDGSASKSSPQGTSPNGSDL